MEDSKRAPRPNANVPSLATPVKSRPHHRRTPSFRIRHDQLPTELQRADASPLANISRPPSLPPTLNSGANLEGFDFKSAAFFATSDKDDENSQLQTDRSPSPTGILNTDFVFGGTAADSPRGRGWRPNLPTIEGSRDHSIASRPANSDSDDSFTTAETSFTAKPASSWISTTEVIRSATMGPKTSWEQYMGQQTPGASTYGSQTMQTETHTQAAVGLGIKSSNMDDTVGNLSASLPDVTDMKKAHPYTHPSAVDKTVAMRAGKLHATFPLEQQPFGVVRQKLEKPRPRILPKELQQMIVADLNKPNRGGILPATWPSATSDAAGSESAWSDVTIPDSEHDMIARGEKPEVWSERPHARSFKKIAMRDDIKLKEAYEGAAAALVTMNAEMFQLPFGSRVVCIKTESLNNVFLSIRNGCWSNPVKVNDRIMDMWQSKDTDDKVFFLFSVNGTSKYCGMAEMISPVQRNASPDGWEDSAQGSGCEGTTPVRWLYVKDVKFVHFDHIKQPRNKNAISNMWNGMHFPSEVIREVIKTYITAPHQENILTELIMPDGYEIDVDASEQAGHDVSRATLRGGHSGGRSSRGTYRGTSSNSPNPAIYSRSWRSRPEGRSERSPVDPEAIHRPDTTPSAVVRHNIYNKGGDNPHASLLSPDNSAQPGSFPVMLNPDGTISPMPVDTPSRASTTPTHRSFPQLDGHNPGGTEDNIDQSFNAALASLDRSVAEEYQRSFSPTARESRDGWGNHRGGLGSLRGARSTPLRNNLGLNINVQAANLGPKPSPELSDTSTQHDLSGFHQAMSTPNLTTPQYVPSPQFSSHSKPGYVFNLPELAKPTLPSQSQSYSPSPAKSPFGFSTSHDWSKYPTPIDGGGKDHLQEEFNLTLNRLHELSHKMSGGKLNKDPTIADAGSVSPFTGQEDSLQTPTFHKGHRGRDSEFSKSFDMRLESDALNLITSPKEAGKPTQLPESPLDETQVVPVGHRRRQSSVASFKSQISLETDDSDDESKDSSAYTLEDDGKSDSGGFRLEG